jgi:type IV pilus assembly protein PilF
MVRFDRMGLAGALLAVGLGLGCTTTQGPEVREQVERQSKAKYNLGIDHLDNGRTALALRELLGAEQLTPNDPWVHFALAEAYRRSDRPQDAVLQLERTMQLDPALQSARLNLSGVYIQMGDYAKAAEHSQILVDDPTFPTPWRALTNLGWAQHRMGRNAEARRNLELAIQYSPRYWPALLNLGILEGAEGRSLEAITHFQRVVDLRPGPLAEAEAHYRTAEVLIALGQQEKAVRHLVAVAGLRPNGQWGEKSEAYLKLLR